MVRVLLPTGASGRVPAVGALVGPGPPGPRCRGRQDDPSPPGLEQVQVGLAEHDRLRRAQRRVVQAAEERLRLRSPAAPAARRRSAASQPRRGAGPRSGRRRGGPLDPVDRVRAEEPEFDGVAESVAEHRPLAPLGRPVVGLPTRVVAQAASASRTFQVRDRERGALGPGEGGAAAGSWLCVNAVVRR
jgi:hypothetical protein